jgi:hypothetical protein
MGGVPADVADARYAYRVGSTSIYSINPLIDKI